MAVYMCFSAINHHVTETPEGDMDMETTSNIRDTLCIEQQILSSPLKRAIMIVASAQLARTGHLIIFTFWAGLASCAGVHWQCLL
jgi:hypothetical protein